MEGWIWGPSLEGYEEPSPAGSGDEASGNEDAEATSKRGERNRRETINVNLDEIRELISGDFGRFYGILRDEDLNQVQVRFRVKNVGRDVLERRQMRVQHEILGLLEGEIEFTSVRVETNRPDGSGEVGVELAESFVDVIRRVAGEDLETWRAESRFSSDSGESWN